MKTITTINWVIVGIYGLGLLWAFASDTSSEQDAAGRGMLAGILFLTVLFVVTIVVLNRLPYSWSKITALVLGGGPLVMYLLSQIVGPLLPDSSRTGNSIEYFGRANGSYYFHDPVRQQLAAIIAVGNITQLQTSLQQPIPELNESGEEHMTLLDFATSKALESTSPAGLQCVELLMDKGATVENADLLHKPTHFLVAQNNVLLEWFLKKGANPNAKSPDGTPLLFDVLFAGNDDGKRTERVKLLLDFGADPNAVPPQQERVINTSALIHAVDNELWDVCQLLLDKGADPAYRTPDGRSVQQVMTYKESGLGATPPADFIALKERLNKMVANK